MLANAKKALRSGLYADGYNFNDDKLVWLYIIKRFLILIFFFFRDWDQVVTHEQIEWGEESNAINKEQRICHLWEIECGAKWKSATEKIPGDVTLNGKLFPFRLLYMWRQRQGCAPYSQQIYSVIRSLQTPFSLHDNTNNTHTEAHRRTN